MSTSSAIPFPSTNGTLAAILSVFIPGAGQVYLRAWSRGIAIFVTTSITVFLILWAADNFSATFGRATVAGLWLLLAFFAIWNVIDAYRLSHGTRSPAWLGFLFPVLAIYAIAWLVTDVRLDRLVTRFDNLLKIGSDVFHPDLFVQDATGSWRPSENFGYIFGTIGSAAAPDVLVRLGLVAPGTQIPTFEAGKIVETIALGLISTIFSTILAVPLSFFAAHNIMSRLPGGSIIYYLMRTILNIVRAIDTLIWGLIVVLWVGLGSFAGVIALTIHSIAALGKLFSEEVEHIDPGPIEAVTASGANLLQTIRYAVIPQVIPSFLAYTLLRWDINMRSATIVGFVAGGGIGFFVVETIRKGGYTQYAAALWAVAIVIMIVDYISAKWRERILVGDTKVTLVRPKPFYTSLRAWFYIIVGAAAFIYFWNLCDIDLKELLDPAPTLGLFVSGVINFNLSPEVVNNVLNQMIVTLFQALLATTLGAIVAIPFSFLAARNLTGRSRFSIWVYYISRGMFNLLRSIEALMYIAIFFFWVGFGNYPGMLALAVTTFGLIGKLFSEAIENIDPGPLEAIMSTGATRLQAIAYGILPQIVPPFVSYSIYQWDINVRMATIVGFAGGGGIGNLLANVYFPFSSYRSAGSAIASIVIVVTIMDFASAKIRERMV
jgi:phosphonate ABC transporter permease subunit PhnE